MDIKLLEPNKLDLDTIEEFQNQGVDVEKLEFALICSEDLLDENEKLIPSDTLGLRRMALRSFQDIEWKRLFYKDKPHAVGLAYDDNGLG